MPGSRQTVRQAQTHTRDEEAVLSVTGLASTRSASRRSRDQPAHGGRYEHVGTTRRNSWWLSFTSDRIVRLDGVAGSDYRDRWGFWRTEKRTCPAIRLAASKTDQKRKAADTVRQAPVLPSRACSNARVRQANDWSKRWPSPTIVGSLAPGNSLDAPVFSAALATTMPARRPATVAARAVVVHRHATDCRREIDRRTPSPSRSLCRWNAVPASVYHGRCRSHAVAGDYQRSTS